MSVRERRVLLTVLGALTFASVYATVVVAPVLTQIAAEFGVTTGTAGLLVAAYGAPGILVSLITGPYSDRFGRKRFLVSGAATMGLFTLLAALATSFPMLLALRTLAGIGAALIFPNVSATIGDSFAYRDRGRAMSTVIAFNTMASVIGVPAAGIVAEATSWRVSLAIVGALCLGASALLFFLLRPTQIRVSESKFFELYRTILRSSSAVAATASSFLGSLYWFAWSTYIVVFFEHVYGLPRGTASIFALTLGLGVFVGSQVGGRLGDRIGHKPVVASAIVISAVLLLTLTNTSLPLAAGAVLNLVLSAVIGARFATNQTLMTEQMPAARGTLLALSSSTIGLAIVIAASFAGLLIDTLGFRAVGIFCFVAAMSSALIVALFVREEPIDMEIAPA
ncbi:MAG TPA: MFS transporter [Candidatus Limnocylindria bacterium]|nr:MFS transporter [Candidatus Limnocylindria bacterium]